MSRIAPLAILGAAPRFDEPLHVGRPHLVDRSDLYRAIDEIFDAHWLTNDGPRVRAFEEAVRAVLGVEHCVAMANATVALQLVMVGLGLRGEVVLPSFTFAATAHAVVLSGLTPVFADIDPRTHLLTPETVDAVIGDATGAVLGVHLWGQRCDPTPSSRVRARDLPVLFDAAHAFGSRGQDGPVGTTGVASVFSFHATKIINSFEGGVVATDDAALAKELRLLRNFGFTGIDAVARIGTNAKMSEIHAAMGLASLPHLPAIIEGNARNHAAYQRALGDLHGVRLLETPAGGGWNAQYVVLEVGDDAPLNRDDVHQVLQAERVLARRYFTQPCHLMPAYAERAATRPRPLPETERISRTVLCLPTGASVGVGEIERIGDCLHEAFARAAEVRAALARRSAERAE